MSTGTPEPELLLPVPAVLPVVWKDRGGGPTWLLAPADCHLAHVVRTNGTFYEADLIGHIARAELEGVFIDVGAHVGNHTVAFARVCGAKRIIAIEPTPQTCSFLLANVRRLIDDPGVDCAVRVLTCAVGTTGREPGDHWGAMSSVRHHNTGLPELSGPAGSLTFDSLGAEPIVAVSTIDDIVEHHAEGQPVACIKLDIQGGENAALAGAVNTLRSFRPLLAVEVGTPSRLRLIQTWLAGFGYELAGMYCATPTAVFVCPAEST